MPDGWSNLPPDDDDEQSSGGKPRRRRRNELALLLSDIDLFRDQTGTAYASVPDGSRREHVAISSRDFRHFITCAYYKQTGSGLSGTALTEVQSLAEARAFTSGDSNTTFRRWGLDPEGNVWADLGGNNSSRERRSVRITPSGWEIVEREPAVKFLRGPDAMPLPEPRADEATIEDMKVFASVDAVDSLILLTAGMICSLRPFAIGGSYPVTVLHGEQGSGKSATAREFQALVDPSSLMGRALPREERDLFISAKNRHLCSFDNVSSISDSFSDCLCRLSTGGGFSARTLHSDADETIFALSRPVLINGIPSMLGRADLADRAISIELRPIRERRTDAEIAQQMQGLRPGLMGLLCDGISSALRNLPTTTITDPPRMADASQWAEAAAQGLGIDPGRITAAWKANRAGADRMMLEADDVAMAIAELMDVESGSWKGQPGELFRRLVEVAGERVSRGPLWPKSAAGLGAKLKRLGPALRTVHGIDVISSRGGADGSRFWTVRKL